jgi:tetratricopeptide (TPR) repeat protein
MKNLLLFLFPVILIASCNSSSDRTDQTADSLQQLLQSIRDSIKKYPDDPRPKYNLAIVLQDAGLYKEAVAALDSMNITKPDTANPKLFFDYLFKRSELLELAGDTMNAIKTLERFVMPGELTQAGLRLANLYAETKNPKTISFCDSMIKNDATGKDPNPNYLKGVYYYNINNYGKALAEFNECIRRDYTFIDAYMEKGRILYKQKKYKEAIAVYDLALSVSNTFADAFLWKAKCQEALGQKQEARLNYQRAYGLDKTLTEAKEAADRINN